MTDPRLDREVAGIRCREVLVDLTDYLDGDLPGGRVRQIEGHLEGCDRCARFGGRVGSMIRSLRMELAAATPLEPAFRERLRIAVRSGIERTS